MVYSGKGMGTNFTAIRHSNAIMKNLIHDYMNKLHIAEELLRKETFVCATLNRKRYLQFVLNNKQKWWRWFKSTKVQCKWKDKREVRMISTKNKHEMRQIITQLSCIDRVNQMVVYYSLPMKLRQYQIIFFHFLDHYVSSGKEIFHKVTGRCDKSLTF
ncbi:hypothetical protein J437_LFUL006194 [Ladona fulva]|uniref:Uncharacterized protein n=1 Tax=Ladona fulva TaxID=123851 RepID=A0A8K0NVD0_LADFU|nr:hypothetical protein J437_LFUL006194 [Ladona fulva]